MVSRKLFYSLAYFLLLGIPAVILSLFVREKLDMNVILLVTAISLLVGGVFDIWAVKQNNKDRFYIWEYNSKSILGFKIYGVPIEDYIFFLVFTPFFIIVIYETVKEFLYLQDKFIFVLFFAMVLIIIYHFVWRYAVKKRN